MPLMKILAAPNALKGTLAAPEAASAIAEGLRRVLPEACILELPIADGGDGTAQLLTRALHGVEVTARVSDPLGRPLTARYGQVDAGKSAVLDVASASGLALLREDERAPLFTTSRGTGELLRHALASGAHSALLGVGGSATVDGGIGLLSALGARFLDAQGKPVAPTGGGLLSVSAIDTTKLACAAALRVVCDVENPLTGEDGAARAFAPQKGADARAVSALEAGLERFAELLEKTSGRSVRGLKFGGAAGGIAAALYALLGAELVPGVDLVLDRIGFDAALADADWVITAEGRLDAGSLRNKGPVGVARRAHARGVPTIALVGSIDPALDLVRTPFTEVLVLAPLANSEPARRDTRAELVRSAETAAHVLLSPPSARSR